MFAWSVFAQTGDSLYTGSIPEELLRPKRGEVFFPIDTVIGELGQGRATASAYSFAQSAARALVSGNAEHSALASLNRLMRESCLSALEPVKPQSFRLGSGAEEADGAFSFLVRFIGRGLAVTGELFVRLVERQEEGVVVERRWVFEDIILEDARSREQDEEMSKRQFDFPPYQRFF